MPEILMSDILAKDISEEVSAPPEIIRSNQPIDAVLDKFASDPNTRHLYVVDDDDRLVGSIRLNDLIEVMFPHSAYGIKIDFKQKGFFFYQKNILAMDIMKRNPLFVRNSTPLPDIIELMVSNVVNELPLIDDDMKVVSEINFLEIIRCYKKLKDNGGAA